MGSVILNTDGTNIMHVWRETPDDPSSRSGAEFEVRRRSLDIIRSPRSVHYAEVVRLVIRIGQSVSDHVLRIRIKSDELVNNCSASIDRWDDNAWQEVWRVSPVGMATPAGLADGGEVRASSFTLDRAVLIDRVIATVL